MQTTQTQNDRCPKCIEFDAETKKKLLELFSVDELTLFTYLIAASIKIQAIQEQKLKAARDVKYIACRRDIDFAATIAGKLLMGFEEEYRHKVIQQVIKDHGIALTLRHAKCPHQEPSGAA